MEISKDGKPSFGAEFGAADDDPGGNWGGDIELGGVGVADLGGEVF